MSRLDRRTYLALGMLVALVVVLMDEFVGRTAAIVSGSLLGLKYSHDAYRDDRAERREIEERP